MYAAELFEEKKNTRLVNRGRNNDTVVLPSRLFFFSPVSAALQGRGGVVTVPAGWNKRHNNNNLKKRQFGGV